MKRKITYLSIFAVLLAAAGFISLKAGSQDQQREGYIRPELRNAVNVTPKMLAPFRFSQAEFWYDGMLDDPRTGNFHGGYLSIKYSTSPKGQQVIDSKNRIELKAYNITASTYEYSSQEIYSPATGRILRQTMKGDYSAILTYGAPTSSIKIDKTADYDWENKRIIVRLSDPKAPVRTYPLQDNTTAYFSIYNFMMKGKWTDTSKIYKFHYFNIAEEIYEDRYIKFAGKVNKNMLKYVTVWHGWGEGGQLIYWITPPKSGSPNGVINRFIVDPKVSRYTTYKLTTKKDATRPVRPMVD